MSPCVQADLLSWFNNIVEGGVSSKVRAVLRNYNELISFNRVVVFWWCYVYPGNERAMHEIYTALPNVFLTDFSFSVCAALPARQHRGLNWGTEQCRGVFPHCLALVLDGLIDGYGHSVGNTIYSTSQS